MKICLFLGGYYGKYCVIDFGSVHICYRIVNIKGNINTIHSYNRRKVKEEDIPKYGKAVGTRNAGVSLVLGFIVSFWGEEMIAYITHPAVVVGLGFMLYGQFKYNKGIFENIGNFKDNFNFHKHQSEYI